jgi:hypothetical protein
MPVHKIDADRWELQLRKKDAEKAITSIVKANLSKITL